MLLWIIAAYLVIGVLLTAYISKGTFWFNEMTDKDVGTWIGTILGLIILIVMAPCICAYALVRACIIMIRVYKEVES